MTIRTWEVSPEIELAIFNALTANCEVVPTCELLIVCGPREARGFGDDTGVAEIGNKFIEASTTPKPGELLAF